MDPERGLSERDRSRYRSPRHRLHSCTSRVVKRVTAFSSAQPRSQLPAPAVFLRWAKASLSPIAPSSSA